NLVTATPLAPEESFSAFLGENPNGTWVLTISDDAGGDEGTLDSVYIHLATTGNILPVELVSFNYNVSDNGVNLSWMTSSELNNSGFEVQRFSESKWDVLSFVKGKGTTTESNSYSFIDDDLLSGKYLYRLKQVNFNGTFEYSKTLEVDYQKAVSYNLYQNYPNPFNPSTKITFSIPEGGIVKLTVHNIIGETISTLVNQKMDKGIHSFEFDASKLNMNKNGLPSGIYLFRIEINNFTSTKKMILLK
ncbi:MAG: T9SS C-terminal target domain-containing protein, partial [Ignavibacteriales bacterium]